MPSNGLALQSLAPSSAANKRKRKGNTTAKANSQSNRRTVAAETSQPPSIKKSMDMDPKIVSSNLNMFQARILS